MMVTIIVIVIIKGDNGYDDDDDHRDHDVDEMMKETIPAWVHT